MTEHPRMNPEKPHRLHRLAAITGAAVVAGIIAVSSGGVASAQSVVDDASTAETSVTLAQADGDSGDDSGGDAQDFAPSPEDEAVWQRFDECLTDAGIDFESEAEITDDVWDAALEQCEPILDDLSEQFSGFEGDFEFEDNFGDLSPEDEAVWERFNECLTDAGVNELSDAEPFDEAALEAAFASCEPILDDLSEDARSALEDCPEADEHVAEGAEA